ncbi:MAG TPA: hypothetical protein VGB92_14665 [Longimicrobium sp.]|jgi:hypothetical protein
MRIRRSLATLALVMGALSAGCTAEVKDEGSLPDVEVKGGEAPNVDVDPAQVNVGSDTNTVVTPTVDVTPAEGNKQ